jgi:NAD(P)-dependent dehydrogenase (short-subunit alcohol dehydrogenase family)
MLLEGRVALLTGSVRGTGAGIARVFVRRLGTVEDTANVALFLASELGSFVTGLYIPVCGGQIME